MRRASVEDRLTFARHALVLIEAALSRRLVDGEQRIGSLDGDRVNRSRERFSVAHIGDHFGVARLVGLAVRREGRGHDDGQP